MYDWELRLFDKYNGEAKETKEEFEARMYDEITDFLWGGDYDSKSDVG